MNVRLVALLRGLVAALLVGGSLAWLGAQQARPPVDIDPDDIGGVVTSAKGPEGGVWVIAETDDLQTKFVRIVVTDDQGRYVLPDLPPANYRVFVRGYGLLDSARQTARPGRLLNLQADVAPDARSAAQVYPAAWWLSMVEAPSGPEAREFPMHMKGCYDCHQLGNKATRELLPAMRAGTASALEAWDRRTAVGPSGPAMGGSFKAIGDHRKVFGDWIDRVAKGEAPRVAPPRPRGVERNLVITQWDWGSETDGRSDMAASDIRNPQVSANGQVFGVAEMTDSLTVLDPREHRSWVVKVPSQAPPLVSSFNAAPTPSPSFGPDIWRRTADVRSLAIDGQGRAWMAARNRASADQPAFCTADSNKYGRYYPVSQSSRQVAVYDPRTERWEHIDTCFSADHNMLSEDGFLYFGSAPAMVAWVDTNTWNKTKDAEASQGWCPAVLDTNGDGRITEWTEPNQPLDPARDARIQFGCYSIAVHPKDGSLWCSGIGRGDKRLMRLEKGPNPPETCKAEFYEPPTTEVPEVFGSGGVEVDHNGVVWQNWRASGHLASFDRTKCRSTRDPKATGQSCPEGWTFYRKDDPTYANSIYHANESYLQHMDLHDTLGLGRDVPVYGSVNTDAFEAFVPTTGQFVTLRVPYPMGFFPRSANGRIDNPNIGWKGRGLWASFSTYATWHIEGGKGEGGPGVRPKAIKFQMRPNPLAK